MRKINLADASFLYLEKREIPMHVAGLLLFTLPERANYQKFMGDLGRILKSGEELRKPFEEYVTTSKLGQIGGLYWEKDKNLDFDYHVRHSALPKPGRYRELFALVSRLHGTLLDRSRPLWEAHLIEGVQDRQFALYLKMHHAAVDGTTGLQIATGMCSTNKRTKTAYSPLSLEAYEKLKQEKYGASPGRIVPKRSELATVFEVLKQQFDSSVSLAGVVREYAKTWLGTGAGLAVPWHQVPRTPMSSRISGSRRFVAQSWSLDRVRTIQKAMDATVNDVVLAICAGALRRYLASQNISPRHSLKALVPMSLRNAADVDSSNAVGCITADLATNITDPEKRFRKIKQSTEAGKALLKGLSAREAQLLWQLTQLPTLLTSLLGIVDRMPTFSTIISNVPGPRKQLYWNGAPLNGVYPVNIPFDGMAMSITLVSYNNMLDFGLIACRRSMPDMQRMIDFIEDSLVELEEIAGGRA